MLHTPEADVYSLCLYFFHRESIKNGQKLHKLCKFRPNKKSQNKKLSVNKKKSDPYTDTYTHTKSHSRRNACSIYFFTFFINNIYDVYIFSIRHKFVRHRQIDDCCGCCKLQRSQVTYEIIIHSSNHLYTYLRHLSNGESYDSKQNSQSNAL